LDVQQITAVSLQCVADIAECGAVAQDDLPVGARAGEQPPVELRTREGSAGQDHDAPVALGAVAEVEWLGEGGVQAVREGEAGVRKMISAGWLSRRRVVGMGLKRRDGDVHPIGEW
jgi:hypothetical protein